MMKKRFLSLILFVAITLPAFAADHREDVCSKTDQEEIEAILALDPNAPGKEVVGEHLARLEALCSTSPDDTH